MTRALVLAVACTAALAGCGGGSDEERIADTVAEFADAVAAQDGEKACGTLTGALREQLGEGPAGDCGSTVDTALQRTTAADRRRLTTAKRAKPRIDGDRATVRVLGVGSIELVEEDGDWVVAGVPGTGLQQVLAETYVREFNAIGRTLERTLTTLGEDLTGSTRPAQIATKLAEGAKALRSAAAELRKTDPPQDARGPHADIVAGVRALARRFDEGAAKARANDLDELVQIFSTLGQSAGAVKIRGAQRRLRELGYRVDE